MPWLLLKPATKQDTEDTKFVVFFPRNEIEETSMVIKKLLAIRQFLFAIKDQLHINNIYDISKDINVETKKSKKSNKKA